MDRWNGMEWTGQIERWMDGWNGMDRTDREMDGWIDGWMNVMDS